MASIDDPMPPPAEPPIVLVAGPTGVGKSALALDLAERLGGEIISADSRQVYRGMAIGTAQPTPAELDRVPHDLIGFLAPDRPFSAAQFVDAAERALACIADRGRIALLVGGTHHYVQALLDRLDLPRVEPRWELRRELAAQAAADGAAALHARLAVLDRAAAAEIQPANVRRTIRALEVIAATGRPFSALSRRRGRPRDALRLALTMPRAELYARQDARVEAMLTAGWLDEIRALLAAGYAPGLPALTSTGYRELIRYLRGEIRLDEAIGLVKYSTHAYTRRQYAWLRRDPRIEWLEHGPDVVERAIARVGAYLTARARGEEGT